MNYSRTDDLNIGWAGDLGDDAEPQQRRSGMEREVDPEHCDPGALVAALGPRDSTAATPSQAPFDSLAERAAWHSASPPEVVARAWQAVEDAVAAAVDADRLERAVDGEEAQAERTEAARVRALTAAGKPAKASAGRDFSAERRHLAAVAAGHRERARRARDAYSGLVEQHRPAWAASLIEQLPSAKASALEALTEVGDRVERLLGDATAAQSLSLETGGSMVALPVLPVRRFLEALEVVAAEIEASVQLGGEALVRPQMTPSWSARQQIAAGIRHGQLDSGAHWLAEVERREGYRLSAWTRGIAMGEKPSETAQW